MIVDLLDASRAITYALIGWCIVAGLLFSLGIAAITWAVRSILRTRRDTA